jgi:hypothetical protein
MPDLPRKGALEDEVAHRLQLLVTERAPRVVLQTVTRKAISRPAAVQIGQPVQELYTWRCPALPNELPSSVRD